MHHEKHAGVTLNPIESSNIHSMGYDSGTQELHVRFHSGAHGHYQNVSPNMYTTILSAPSKGKALHKLVVKHPKKHPWVSHEK